MADDKLFPPKSTPDQLPDGTAPDPAAAGASAYMQSAADSGEINLDDLLAPPSGQAAPDSGSLPGFNQPPPAAERKKSAPVQVANDFPEAALGSSPSLSPINASGENSAAQTPQLNVFFSGLSAFFLWFWTRICSVPPIDDVFDRLLFFMGLQRNPSSMLRRANTLAHKGRLVEAVKWYRDLLVLRPLSVAAYDGLGRVYFRMGLSEEANREFTIADNMERILHNRDDIEAAASLAAAFLERKQAKISVSLIEPVLIAHFYTPNNSDLLKAMGRVYTELRATKKMYQVYSAGLVQYPDDHEFYILKGNAELKLGNVAEGERLVRWGRLMGKLRENPTDANAKMVMGEMCLKEQKFDESLRYLREAAALMPEHTDVRWRLYNLCLKQGHIEEAQKYLLEIAALEPENEEMQYRLADFYRKHQKKNDALIIYRELSEQHPREPKPHALMGELMMEMGLFEDGQKMKELALVLEGGLKASPDHKETVAFMKHLISIGRYEEANQWLERGLAKWPYHGELVLTKAKQLYNEYRYAEAVTLLKRLISVKPDIAEPNIWLAMCYQRQGDNMAALAKAQLATRLAPKSFSAHKVLGDILKEQKKLSQANAAYEVAEMMRQSAIKK